MNAFLKITNKVQNVVFPIINFIAPEYLLMKGNLLKMKPAQDKAYNAKNEDFKKLVLCVTTIFRLLVAAVAFGNAATLAATVFFETEVLDLYKSNCS